MAVEKEKVDESPTSGSLFRDGTWCHTIMTPMALRAQCRGRKTFPLSGRLSVSVRVSYPQA